jgi:hypothetical protein
MRQTIFSLAVLSLSLCSSAQPRRSDNSTQPAIRFVKTLSTSSFDSRLPRISLADFLSYETGSLQGKWAVVGCEKQTVPAADHANQDLVTCVQADYDVKRSELDTPGWWSLSGGGLVTILVAVKTSTNGQFRADAILNLAFTDVTGVVHQIRNLADLPMELHRLAPRTPKDLPVPVG